MSHRIHPLRISICTTGIGLAAIGWFGVPEASAAAEVPPVAVAVASLIAPVDNCGSSPNCNPPIGPVAEGAMTVVGSLQAGSIIVTKLDVAAWSATMNGATATIPTVVFTATSATLEALQGTCSGEFVLTGAVPGSPIGVPLEPQYGQAMQCNGTAGTTPISFSLVVQGFLIDSEFVAYDADQ